MSSDKFHCANGNCLTDCALSSIDYDADFPPRFCPHSGSVVCWKKRETNEKKPSLFDKITVSAEVLAEKLVYLVRDSYNGAANYYWCSTVADGMWKTKQEAISATVAELKGGGDE
jgi:hypothetical protein